MKSQTVGVAVYLAACLVAGALGAFAAHVITGRHQ